MTQGSRGEVVVYQGKDGALRIEAKMAGESIWLPMADMAKLFGVKVPAISKHVKNIYATRELSPRATVSKMETVRREGRRQVTRTVEHYSLDMIISVGYRVNSTKATRFRIWATQTLKEHLTRGYTLNRQRFEHNARELETALQLVRKAAAGEALTTDQGRGLVDVIARYTRFIAPAKPVPHGAGGNPVSTGMKQPAVYILASKRNGTLYTGVTSDLRRRVFEHRNDLAEGFTKKYGVHNLVYFELHVSMSAAITREKQIKKWNRAWKLRMIELQNPDWEDLWQRIL